MHLSLTTKMSNSEIAALFEFIADVLEAQDANRFRVGAYRNVASSIEAYPDSLQKLYQEGADFNQKVPAVGEAIADKLNELFKTGDIKELQEIVADIPAGMLPLTKVHGIGGKRAYQLSTHFNLTNETTALSKLLDHAKRGEIQTLEGFGRKSEQDIISQLQNHTGRKDRMSYSEASQIAQEIIKHLIRIESVSNAEIMGSLRRKELTVGDIDIGIVTNNIGSVKKVVKSMKNVKKVEVAGDQLIRIIRTDGIQVDIKAVPKEEWGSFLQHFTGSKNHNVKLRELALKQHKSLSEHGIKILDPKTDKPLEQLKFNNESDFYHELGFKWIPPEERTGNTELSRYKIQVTN